MNSLSNKDTVTGPYYWVDKGMVKELINKMKNGKTTGPQGSVLEIIDSAC